MISITLQHAKLIVGGKEVPKFQYPWLVSLETSNFHICGGTLLDANNVLTAAHCGVGERPSPSLTAVAHRHDLTSDVDAENSVVFEVKRIINHPQYDSKTNAFDAAIWKIQVVSGDLKTLSGAIGAVEIDDGSLGFKSNTTLTIAGWGDTLENGPSSQVLLEAQVDIVDSKDCKKAYDYLDASSLCAAAPGKDTCQGDSGGPLFKPSGKKGKVTLVGITSFGDGCANAKYPGAYARTSSIIDWIRKTTKNPNPPASPSDQGDEGIP
jgi:trypsin